MASIDKSKFQFVKRDDFASETIDAPAYSYWKSVMRQFFKKKSTVVMLGILIAIVLMSFIYPMFSKFDFNDVSKVNDFSLRYVHPNAQYWFGTDSNGKSLFDSVSTGVLTFLLSLPTIALVYIIRLIGSEIGLPDSFPILGAGDWRSYVLPSVILGLLSTPGLAIWIRRYMIDLQSQDFVRFARAKGLSEQEISNKHIFKNAMVSLVSGIPASIVSVITGATLTETIFAFPGMGKMLIDSVRASNNAMVVGLVFIFTALTIFSLLVGDILMTIIDPRIKLTSKGGK